MVLSNHWLLRMDLELSSLSSLVFMHTAYPWFSNMAVAFKRMDDVKTSQNVLGNCCAVVVFGTRLK